MTRSSARFLAVVSAALLLAACGGGGGSGSTVLVASQVIDAAGGTLTVTDPTSPIEGAAVVVPPGALAAPTEITISQVVSGGPYPGNVLTLELGPAGTSFAVPVTVTVPYRPQYLTDLGITDPGTIHIVRASSGDAPETLATESRDDLAYTVTARTSGFSTFAALGYSNASLSGAYAFCGFAVDVTPGNIAVPIDIPGVPYSGGLDVPIIPNGFASDDGIATFNGSGGFSYSQTSNEDGSTVSLSGSGAYSVASDGTLTMGNLSGCVLSGGSMFVVASTSGEPQVIVGIRKGGTFTNASLSGSYAFCGFAVDVTPGNIAVPINVPAVPYTGGLDVPIIPNGFASDDGIATFNGSGGFSYSQTSNEDGSTVSLSGSGSYTVASDGTLTMGNLSGCVLAGGSVFVAASTSGEPQILVGIRKAGTFTNASLSAGHAFAGFAVDVTPGNIAVPIDIPGVPYSGGLDVPIVPNGYASDDGIATFNGSGGFSYSQTSNEDGSTVSLSGSGSYTVASDGTLTMGNLSGCVLAGGSVFVAASTSGEPQILVGILKK